jgi:hypothetical protein
VARQEGRAQPQQGGLAGPQAAAVLRAAGVDHLHRHVVVIHQEGPAAQLAGHRLQRGQAGISLLIFP